MELWKELLSSYVGILSLLTIVVAAGMVGYCVWLFVKKAREAEEAERRASGRLAAR
ncbi:DUF3149 domain-containing protein [Crenobacter cavernae]|uniref:DUF3149 domain-containing protein n=1 Tax=Crenobacter cavernae TaxID=2290923 RepID=A0A345Y360_9NEIS|nr:DUF3149 domain-containing protein [Crenobacter cavernae]AXK38362.1 DUF3149 domain-containing protein [Crenobacter cavernae]